MQGQINHPWKNTFIGALDPQSWPGLVVISSQHSAYAFSPVVYRGKDKAEFQDFFYLVSEVGDHSPDGSYASMKFDMHLPFKKGNETPVYLKPALPENEMTIEWSRRDENTVIGKYHFPRLVDKVTLIFYFPWDFKGWFRYRPETGCVYGQSPGPPINCYLCWLSQTPEEVRTVGSELHLLFNSRKSSELFFVASAGQAPESIAGHISHFLKIKTINSLVAEEKSRYQKKRTVIKGLYEGSSEAIANNLFWLALYQNGHHRLYTPAGRGWIFPRPDGQPDDWTIFAWDSFFNSLEASIEDTYLAFDIVRSVLETQYENGNIPNWRGRYGGAEDRSQPPVGSYAVLKLFLKTGDLEFLKEAYPYLVKWHQFWTSVLPGGQVRRDGNNNGLLEWGSDLDLTPKEVPPWEEEAGGKQKAMWESGQDDLPNWDEATFNYVTGTLEMDSVDLNSLYALDSYCLSQLASFLGKEAEQNGFLREYEKTRKLMNKLLWNEKEGYYFDRHWNGSFSARRAASNFFPLIAKIPDQGQALKMLKHLLNPAEFWGDYVLPTISRDDPAYPDQQYWRGTIWPPTNYLVYEGLKAYGYDQVAADLAERSSNLFLRIWKNYALCPENFDSRTGEAGGQRYQSWGPLFALIAIEEYLDVTPWDGFRFGQLQPKTKGSLKRIGILGRNYEVEISPDGIKLIEEKKELIKTDGPAVFRHFLYSDREISFEIKSLKKRKINISLGQERQGQLILDGKEAGKFAGSRLKLQVPEGEHRLVIIISD
ncbi:MAG: trehalase family glycosidase [Acidobacteriota bacterium]|nr:trehalase family glycosidase [Acidobacteriota bacterium]